MDTEKACQEWEKVHSGPGKSFYTNVLDQGLNCKPTVTRKELYESRWGIAPEEWHEAYLRLYHPYRYRVRQGTKKIIGLCDRAFHETWYWSVYFYYLILYFFLFLGPGCASDRDSSL